LDNLSERLHQESENRSRVELSCKQQQQGDYLGPVHTTQQGIENRGFNLITPQMMFSVYTAPEVIKKTQ